MAEVRACLEPLLSGEPLPIEVVVYDQRGREDLADLVRELSASATNPVRLERIEDRSLSHARNVALERSAAPWVAFLDPDTVPSKDWAREVLQAFEARAPAVVAGRIFPLHGRPPGALNRSRLVAEVQSTMDLGDAPAWTDRAIGANFAVDRRRIGAHRFREDLGRQGGALLGGEETEFCERVAPGQGVLYWPAAWVHHRVPAGRMTAAWLVRRFYFGGLSRGLRGGAPRPLTRRRTANDVLALALVGPGYAIGLLKGRRLRARMARRPARGL